MKVSLNFFLEKAKKKGIWKLLILFDDDSGDQLKFAISSKNMDRSSRYSRKFFCFRNAANEDRNLLRDLRSILFSSPPQLLFLEYHPHCFSVKFLRCLSDSCNDFINLFLEAWALTGFLLSFPCLVGAYLPVQRHTAPGIRQWRPKFRPHFWESSNYAPQTNLTLHF